MEELQTDTLYLAATRPAMAGLGGGTRGTRTEFFDIVKDYAGAQAEVQLVPAGGGQTSESMADEHYGRATARR